MLSGHPVEGTSPQVTMRSTYLGVVTYQSSGAEVIIGYGIPTDMTCVVIFDRRPHREVINTKQTIEAASKRWKHPRWIRQWCIMDGGMVASPVRLPYKARFETQQVTQSHKRFSGLPDGNPLAWD